MSEDTELESMIREMFEDYNKNGFDFNSDQSLNDIFFGIFSDAVNMTIDMLGEQDNLESEGIEG